MNETLVKFGHPATLVRDYRHWCVLLRPQQATLGALVLGAKDDWRSFASLPVEAFADARWPEPNDLNSAVSLETGLRAKLTNAIASQWETA